MRFIQKILIAMLVLLPASLWAQNIELSGPSTSIDTGNPIQISVEGIVKTEEETVDLVCTPNEGVEAWLAKKLPNGPLYVNFTSSRKGSYKVEVSVGNADLARWRESIVSSVSDLQSSLLEVDKAILKGTVAGAQPQIITTLQGASKTLKEQIDKTLKEEADKIDGRYGFCVVQVGDSPNPNPNTNPYSAPSLEKAVIVEPITKISLPSSVAISLSQIFNQAATSVKTNLARMAAGVEPEMGTTVQLHQFLSQKIKLLGIEGKYDGLASSVDKAIKDMGIGLDSRKIKPEDEEALLTVAWALYEISLK